MHPTDLKLAKELWAITFNLRWQSNDSHRKVYDCIMDQIYALPGASETDDWMN